MGLSKKKKDEKPPHAKASVTAFPEVKIFIRKRSRNDGWNQGPARIWEEVMQVIDRSSQEERDGSAETLQTPEASGPPQFRGWFWL